MALQEFSFNGCNIFKITAELGLFMSPHCTTFYAKFIWCSLLRGTTFPVLFLLFFQRSTSRVYECLANNFWRYHANGIPLPIPRQSRCKFPAVSWVDVMLRLLPFLLVSSGMVPAKGVTNSALHVF